MTTSAAVVTGISRGLGAAIAGHLLAGGVPVLGLSRGTNHELADRYGSSLTQVPIDLADAAALEAWLGTGTLRSHLQSAELAVLVNNAGILHPIGPLAVQDPSAVSRAVAVNVGAALTLSAAFVQATPSHNDRRILHVSSGAAHHPYAGWSVYCASKAALDQHARAVALDRTPRLRIGSVAPGVIDTAMQADVRGSRDEWFPDRARFAAMQREGRLIRPEDAGRTLVEYLLSPRFGAEPVVDLRSAGR